MDREPIQSGPEEGGRSQLRSPPGRGPLPSPPPATEREASLEASIRMKFQFGEPLNWEEKRYIRNLPDHDVRYQK